MCALRNVRVPQITEPVQQKSLPCYARLEVNPLGTPNKHLQYYNDIIIFPYSEEIMIFNRIEGTKDYTFLEYFFNHFAGCWYHRLFQ